MKLKPRRRKKIVLVVSLVLVVMSGIFLLIPSEPKYQGRTISEWLKRASTDSIKDNDPQADYRAIQKIGTNAVPILLKKLTMDDSRRQAFAIKWNGIINKIPAGKMAKALEMDEDREKHNHEQAQLGFRVIGTNGSSAIPALTLLLQDKNHRNDAAQCLGYIGTRDALMALEPELTNPDFQFRETCVDAVTDFQPAALVPVAEKLWALRNDPDQVITCEVLRIAPLLFPEERWVPLLIGELQDPNEDVQRAALSGLLFAPESALEPVARYGLSSTNVMNRKMATNVILYINWRRAPEFGVSTNDVTENFLLLRERTFKRQKELSVKH